MTHGLLCPEARAYRLRPAFHPDRAAPAFMGFDVMAGVALTLALLLLVATAATQLAAARRDSEGRRQLRALAEDELTRMRAGLIELPPAGRTRTRQVDGATLEIAASRGSGEWDGFACVRVTGRRAVHGHSVTVVLAGYIPHRESAP
jgi:hypothetical protein